MAPNPPSSTPTWVPPTYRHVALPQNHPLAVVLALVRCGVRMLPAAFVAKAAGRPLHDAGVGGELADVGLVVVAASTNRILLAHANPQLAAVVNETRYADRGTPRSRQELIDIALGNTSASKEHDDERLLAAGRCYTLHRVYGVRLLRAEPIAMRSPWRFRPDGTIERDNIDQ